jgi:competence protein ComEC
LWAVGFQLSYLAVLGIVIFQRPIYNWFYFKNKILDKTWQLMSVSTAAQLLTFPVCIYYFHQFPNLFLFTNIVAVPLAIIILYTAIALLVFSWAPYAGVYLGKLVGGLTWCMNKFILWVNDLPFAVWDRIPATVISTWLLYATVLAFAAWLMRKNKKYFQVAMGVLLLFVLLGTHYKWQAYKQQKLIVYNVPQHRAIDLISGNRYRFIGDSILLEDGLLQNFHLKPGRIARQLKSRADSLNNLFQQNMFYQFKAKRILVLDKPVIFNPALPKINIDVIILSKNPKLSIIQLAKVFNAGQFVFDASNPLWKIKQWQQECKSLQVNYHSVPEAGAFIYDIGI